MTDRDSFNQLTKDLITLYEAGNYVSALDLVEKNVSRFPDMLARTTFWKMCLLSIDGRLDEALSTFQQGLEDGHYWAETEFLDTDLDPLRKIPEFNELVAKSKQRLEQESKKIKRDHNLLVPEVPGNDSYPLLIALHGGAGTKDSYLEHWEIARQKGWLVLSPQSSQPRYPGAYCWADGEQGVTDLEYYVEKISKEYKIDSQCIVTAGFSQGSGMAIYSALSEKINVRGFISIGTYWADPESFTPMAKRTKNVRGYFVTGERDNFLKGIRKIQEILQDNNIQFAEEYYSDLGHEFPADFEKTFTQALDFILEE